MSRKGKKTCAIAVPLLAVVVALCLWAFYPKSYDAIIPEEAKAVVQITPSELPEMLQKDFPLAKALGVGADGLDLSSPLYAFITPNEYVGFCAKVADHDKLAAQFAQLAAQKKVQLLDDSDGLAWAWMNEGWLVAWNGRLVFALGPGTAQERDELQHTMSAMLRSGKTFKKTEKFKRLEEQKGAVKLFSQLDAIPAPYNMLFRLTVPADCDLAAVNVFSSTEFSQEDNGLVTCMESQLTSDNEDVMRAIDAYEKTKTPLDFEASTDILSGLFNLVTSTQGKSLLGLLKTDATLRGLLMGINQTVDVDKMLGSTDGLLALRIDSLAKDWTPSFCLTAETQANDLFADADYWLKSAAKQRNVTLNRLTPADYQLSSDGKQLYFGKDKSCGVLYFSSAKSKDMALANTKLKKGSNNGPLVLFQLDLRKLAEQPCVKQGGAAQLLLNLLPGKEGMSFYASSGGKSHLIIY